MEAVDLFVASTAWSGVSRFSPVRVGWIPM